MVSRSSCLGGPVGHLKELFLLMIQILQHFSYQNMPQAHLYLPDLKDFTAWLSDLGSFARSSSDGPAATLPRTGGRPVSGLKHSRYDGAMSWSPYGCGIINLRYVPLNFRGTYLSFMIPQPYGDPKGYG